MSAVLAAIDFAALGDVVLASVVAGALIVGSYSACLYGVTGYLDRRHAGRDTQALAFAALAALGALVFAGAVIYGFIIMTTK